MRILDWKSLSAVQQRDALQRPAQRDAARVTATAQDIIERVRSDGDAALIALTEQLDGVRLAGLRVTASEFAEAEAELSAKQNAAIERAISTIHRFHAAQMPAPLRVETAPGVQCERISVPIRAVGLYVPAGSAPLPSTAIMLAVPAAIAGCPVRILCTPPNRHAKADPAVLVAARKAGVERVFKVGGAQAIAAMAYGTGTIPKCDKIFGPGNAWVTAAKLLVAQHAEGAAADLPAGVSEVMVIADAGARADFIAADLLAQAEHSPDAQAILVTSDPELAAAAMREVQRQSVRLLRARILTESLKTMRFIVATRSRRRSTLPIVTRRNICCCKFANRAHGCRESRPRAPCSLGPGRRKPWAIIAADPTTPCPPTATLDPTAACRWRTFRSASPFRNSRRRGSKDWARPRKRWPVLKAWMPMQRL